jgi:cholesterol transport system auxiliary component
MKPASFPTIAAALALLLGAGCALTSKSDSLNLRYFTPEGAPVRTASSGPRADLHLDLRLGKVNSASYIKDRIAFRASEYEIGFYDEMRWTEKPESYVRRALVRSLFDEHGIRQLVSGVGLVLDVDLDAFEEMRAPRHAAYVQITWVLHGPLLVVRQRTLTIERPLTATTSEAVAAGLADALREAIGAMVAEVVTELSRSAAAGAVVGPTSAAP